MGYSITLGAAKGGTAPSQTGIASATELSIQVWLKADKLKLAPSTPKSVICWFASALPAGTLKMGVVLIGSSDGNSVTPAIFTPGFADYAPISTSGGSPLDISSLTNTDDVVLYVGYTPTTGVAQQESGIYLENGTIVGGTEGARHLSASSLDTTAGDGNFWFNYEAESFSNGETAGTYKRIAVWNKAVASANRASVPSGSESGLLWLWGNANGFTAGTGTTEPNQVASGSTLTLDASVTWTSIGGGATNAMGDDATSLPTTLALPNPAKQIITVFG